MTPARGFSTWDFALGDGQIGLITEGFTDGSSTLNFQRLSPEGLSVEPAEFLFRTRLSIAQGSVLWHGGQFLIGWESWLARTRQDVGFALIDQRGEQKARWGFTEERRMGWTYPDGDGFLHVYYERTLHSQSISPAGEPVGAPIDFEATLASVGSGDHAWNGEVHALVASAPLARPRGELQLWSNGGERLTDAVHLWDGYSGELAIGWNGIRFAVAWLLADEVRLMEVTAEGTVLDPYVVFSGDVYSLALAPAQEGWLVFSTLRGEGGVREPVLRRVDSESPERWESLFLGAPAGDARGLRVHVSNQLAHAGWYVDSEEAEAYRIELQGLSLCE